MCTGISPYNWTGLSSEDCGYPFTYVGGLYHNCLENLENITTECDPWGCFLVNYTAAVCGANIGITPLTLIIIIIIISDNTGLQLTLISLWQVCD